MAKTKTLYWTLKRDWYAGGFTVMRVTTEKTRQLYGSIDGENTHCNRSQTTGKFETEADAMAVVARVADARKNHKRLLDTLTTARNLAETLEREAIERAVAGLDPEPVPLPMTIVSKAEAIGTGGRVLVGRLT